MASSEPTATTPSAPKDLIVVPMRPSLWDKCVEEPWVPVGIGLTVGCLVMGIRSMKLQQSRNSQYWMRARIAAQAATVAALVIGTTLKQRSGRPPKMFDDAHPPTVRKAEQ